VPSFGQPVDTAPQRSAVRLEVPIWRSSPFRPRVESGNSFIYLFVIGRTLPAVGLLIWCAVVVSTIDNFLRPTLIGRDARMADLLILLSTLGGIFLFGAVGFIVGPIVAALFVTVWHIYGETFRAWLPEVPKGRIAGTGAPGLVAAATRDPDED
jgi:hypothetical protein